VANSQEIADDWWHSVLRSARKLIWDPGRTPGGKENKNWPWPPLGAASERIHASNTKFWMWLLRQNVTQKNQYSPEIAKACMSFWFRWFKKNSSVQKQYYPCDAGIGGPGMNFHGINDAARGTSNAVTALSFSIREIGSGQLATQNLVWLPSLAYPPKKGISDRWSEFGWFIMGILSRRKERGIELVAENDATGEYETQSLYFQWGTGYFGQVWLKHKNYFTLQDDGLFHYWRRRQPGIWLLAIIPCCFRGQLAVIWSDVLRFGFLSIACLPRTNGFLEKRKEVKIEIRFASNMVLKLIDNGVRAVIVAGWAVYDQLRMILQAYYLSVLCFRLRLGKQQRCP